jgi:hypothetical protein
MSNSSSVIFSKACEQIIPKAAGENLHTMKSLQEIKLLWT